MSFEEIKQLCCDEGYYKVYIDDIGTCTGFYYKEYKYKDLLIEGDSTRTRIETTYNNHKLIGRKVTVYDKFLQDLGEVEILSEELEEHEEC